MDNDTKKYLKSFAKNTRMFEAVREYILDFDIIDMNCSDLELGSRVRQREELKRDMLKKFNSISFLVDED